ncbi:hypothetical protein L596_019906 [Steinernema carpocapsae]|uniref:C2H2-type domain-containing protein n=1 Tax=Steinernema carpocapsae TaxID=34508 RepID=A0A4U5MRZ3_STECR|nr:hypothetical protein L596_019906 [Steinernema carpocapsae]
MANSDSFAPLQTKPNRELDTRPSPSRLKHTLQTKIGHPSSPDKRQTVARCLESFFITRFQARIHRIHFVDSSTVLAIASVWFSAAVAGGSGKLFARISAGRASSPFTGRHSEKMTLRYQEDPGLLQATEMPFASFPTIEKMYKDATDEVKHILEAEVSVIFECRCCRSLFRSMHSLITHKRTICRRYHDSSTFTAEKCKEVMEGIRTLFEEAYKPYKKRAISGKRANIVSMVNKRVEMKNLEIPTLPNLVRDTPNTFFIEGSQEVIRKEDEPSGGRSLVVFPSITTSKSGDMTLRNRRIPGDDVEKPRLYDNKMISLMEKANLIYGRFVDIGTLTCTNAACMRSFPTLQAVVCHLHEHSTPLPDGDHLCVVCMQKFDSHLKLLAHLKRDHDYKSATLEKMLQEEKKKSNSSSEQSDRTTSSSTPEASPGKKRGHTSSPESETRPVRSRKAPKWLEGDIYETEPSVVKRKPVSTPSSSSATEGLEVEVDESAETEADETKSDIVSSSVAEKDVPPPDLERAASLQPEGSAKVFCRRQSFEDRERKPFSTMKGSRRKQNLATLATDSDDEGRILALPNGRRPPAPTDLEGIGVFLTGEQRDLLFAGLKAKDPMNPSSEFQCDVCEAVFPNLEAGRPHIIGHIRAIRFKCKQCGVGSFFLNALRNHLMIGACAMNKPSNKPQQADSDLFMSEREADFKIEVVDPRMPGIVKFVTGKIVSDESPTPYKPSEIMERIALRNRDIWLLGTMSFAEYKAALQENFE